MKYLNKSIKSIKIGMIIMALGFLLSCGAEDASAEGLTSVEQASTSSYGWEESTNTQVFDTSFAVEFSYSCLTGGCHEVDHKLVEEYAASKMTHTMVKCNACHGTHTVDTVGLEKPNLTGYYPGIGATGYKVDTDRCKMCHSNEHNVASRKSGDNCYSCHAPHAFNAGGR